MSRFSRLGFLADEDKVLDIAPGLRLPYDIATLTLAFLAMRGSGKTYAALDLVEEMILHGLHVVCVDPVGVMWGLRSSADGKSEGLPVIILGGDHGDVPLEVSAGSVVADFVIESRQPCVLDLSLFRKGEQTRFMVDFAERLYHKNRNPLHLVLDEADAFCPQKPMHEQARLLGAMEDLVRRGRARGIGVTLVSQRAAVINKNVLSVAPWMRAPIWQGWRGRCLRTMEELWEQAAQHYKVKISNDGRKYEYIDLPSGANEIKSLCWHAGHGWWAPIRRIIRHHYKGDLIRLEQKWGEICVTPNHSVYDVSGQLARPQDNPELLAVRHINQQKTRETKEVALSSPRGSCYPDGEWIRWRGKKTAGAMRKKLSGKRLKSFMRFLGGWLAEGSVSNPDGSCSAIEISNLDRGWLLRLQKDASCFSTTRGGVNRASSPKLWALSIGNKVLGHWLSNNGGRDSGTRRFPDFVYDLRWEFVEPMLEAMIKGDGTRYKRGNWSYYTKSSELAQGLGFLLTLHGKGYTTRRDKNTGVYRLIQCDWYNNHDKAHRIMERVPHDGFVYDLEMGDRHAPNFTIGVGNVVVHNTQIECLIALRMTGPQDIAAIKQWIHHHGTEAEQDKVLSSLPSLQRGTGWFWSPGWLKVLQKVSFRKRKTFDSSATPAPGKSIVAPEEFTKVDIEALKEKLAATIERSKEDNPEHLKARIRELEERLKSETVRVLPQRVEIERVPAQLYKDLLEMWRKFNLDVNALENEWQEMNNQVTGRIEDIRRRHTQLGELVEDARFKPTEKQNLLAIGQRGINGGHVHVEPAMTVRKLASLKSGDVAVGKSGIRRMLIALAQRNGLNATQLGLRARVKAKGGSFDTYVSKARVNGWIEGTRDCFKITDKGREALGAYDPLPRGEDLLRHYLEKFGGSGIARMLQALAEAYPRALSREQLGKKSNVSADGGSFDTYISKLRTFELVEGKKEFKASAELFS